MVFAVSLKVPGKLMSLSFLLPPWVDHSEPACVPQNRLGLALQCLSHRVPRLRAVTFVPAAHGERDACVSARPGREDSAAVGVLRAAPTSSCCGRCAAFSSKNAAPPPPPPSSVVWFNQTSSDLCRNLQLPGFLFLPGADNSRFVFEAGEGN